MDNKEQDIAITDLEIQIDRLRALYEQYFMGIEKIEPQVPRKTVERTFVMLRKERIRNTALRFRFLQLVQRYNTMETYWRRVVRQIEEGKYRRFVMAGKRPSEVPPPPPKERFEHHDVDLREYDDDTNPNLSLPPEPGEGAQERKEWTNPSIAELTADSQALYVPAHELPAYATSDYRGGPQAPHHAGHAPPAPGRPPNNAAARPHEPKLPDARIQAIYRDYVSARQRCNQTTHGLTLERVAQQIRSQEDQLRKKHGKDVDFQVVVRDGRAILKAIEKG
jgi:hypothetical protein